MMKIPAVVRSFFYRTSFTRKMMLCFFTMALLVCLIVGGYSANLLRDFSARQAEEAMETVLTHMSESQSQELVRIENIAKNIASNTAVIQAVQITGTTPWVQYTNYRDIIDPLLMSVILMNNEIISAVIYHNNPSLSGHGTVMPIAEASPFIQSLEDRKPMDCVWYSNGNTLQLGMKCAQGNEHLPSVYVEITLSKDRVFRALSVGALDTQLVCLTDQDMGVVWLSSNNPALSDYAQSDPGFLKTYAGMEKREFNLEDASYILYHLPMSDLPFVLHAAIPYQLLLVNTYRLLQMVISIMAGCLLVMMPISLVLSRYSVKRIHTLNVSMAKAEKGDLSVHIDSPYTDEIGMLMQHFNDMIESVRTALEEQKKSEEQQKEAEMQALRSQINPHFLYNTLSLISWKAMEQGAQQAAEIARTFSSFCRTVLNRGQSLSTLYLEMVNVRSYVDIQLDMHDHSFEVIYDVPEAMLPIAVPVFILQPLVENAIIHGLETVRGLEGRILIKIYEQQGDLYCCVENNGSVFEPSVLERTLASTETGYGLRNVQQRIVHLFGEQYGITLLPPDEGYTTCVCLRLRAENYAQEDVSAEH